MSNSHRRNEAATQGVGMSGTERPAVEDKAPVTGEWIRFVAAFYCGAFTHCVENRKIEVDCVP